MPTTNVVIIKPEMIEFLNTVLEDRRRLARRADHRNYSAAEFAREVGAIPQTFNRLLNEHGETAITLDQAKLLIAHFQEAVVDLFDYEKTDAKVLSHMEAVALAGLYQRDMDEQAREEIAGAVMALGTMEPERRAAVISLITKLTAGELDAEKFLTLFQTAPNS